MDYTPVLIAAIFNGAGVIGTVAWIGRLIATGKWVPRSTYDDILAASLKKDEQLAERDIQLRHLEEVGRTVKAIMQAVQKKADVLPVRDEDAP